MTLPANIRVNLGAPFPATVRGAGPVAVSKQNGIWTVSLQPFSNIGLMTPGTDPTTVLVLLYNIVTNTFAQTSLAAISGITAAAKTITSAMSPYAPTAADTFLLVDTTEGAVEIDLALAASRTGVELTIKDVAGNAAVNNITIKPQGAPANETVDGFTNVNPLVVNTNYDGVRLYPSAGKYVVMP